MHATTEVLLKTVFSTQWMRSGYTHTFIRIYSLFRGEHLSANIKLTLYKALIRSVMIYACPAWKLVADTYPFIIAAHAKKGFAHTGLRFAHSFQPSLCIQLYNYLTKVSGNKQKSYKIMIMNMFAPQDKVKPDIENIGGLNLVVVKLMTIQVTKLLL
jgi:hypothetical protein